MMKKKMSKNIILDCDDVLLQWSAGFKPWMEKRGYTQRIHEESHFPVNSQYAISYEEACKLVDEFNTSFYFGMLDPTPGARKAVDWMIADGYRLYVVTSCGTDPSTRRNRHTNLDFVFGPSAFESITFLDHGTSKMTKCAEFPGSFLVDDRYETCLEAERHGIVTPIYMENYMNRHLPWNGPRINSLVEFYNTHIAEKKYA